MATARGKKVNRDYDRVTFDRGFLKAVIIASGRSEADVAQSVGVTQQSIAFMLSGKSGGTCGKSVRKALASELNIPEPILSGKPLAIEGWVGYALGYDILWGSRRGSWAALRLLDRVLKRADKLHFISVRRFKLVYSVGALLRPVTWQQRLTGVERLGQETAPDAVVALAKALEFALEPWLSGAADLNMAELFAMASPKLEQADGSPYPRPTKSVFLSLKSFNELLGGPTEVIDPGKYFGEASVGNPREGRDFTKYFGEA